MPALVMLGDVVVEHEEALGEHIMGQKQQHVGRELVTVGIGVVGVLVEDERVNAVEVALAGVVGAQVLGYLLHFVCQLLFGREVGLQVY